MTASGRVLIVDRDPVARSRLNHILTGRGIASVQADTADQAMALAGADGADIVIINGDSGATGEAERLTRRLKSQTGTAPIPVIVIGGEANGADSVLPHAFKDSELHSRLDVFLRLNTMREELLRRAASARKFGVETPPVATPPSKIDDVRVLIVGKDDRDRGAIDAMLNGQGRLTSVDDGADALTLLRSEAEFDAVVLTAPGETPENKRFCADLRSDSRLFHIPLLTFVDRGATAMDNMTAKTRGISDVIDRPWTATEFRNRLLSAVRQQRYRLVLRNLFRASRQPATTDALTNAYSHGFLFEHLGLQIDHAKRYGRNLTVAVLGVVDMAGLNRLYGYVAGDQVLRQVGAMMNRLVRGEDLVARFSGSKFCLALPDTAPELGFCALHRVASVVEQTELALPDSDQPVRVRLAVGAAGLSLVDSSESIVERAISAMA
jgi:two-component system, cell cycle response regulator